MALGETLKKARFKVSQGSLMEFMLDNQRNVVGDSLNKVDVDPLQWD
jgi:hypothetical protein